MKRLVCLHVGQRACTLSTASQVSPLCLEGGVRQWSQVTGAPTCGMKPASVLVVCGSLRTYKSKSKWALCKSQLSQHPSLCLSKMRPRSLLSPAHTTLCSGRGGTSSASHSLYTPVPRAPDQGQMLRRKLNGKAGRQMGKQPDVMGGKASL